VVTTHLRFLNIYYTITKRKFIAMVTPNTLETMIEYTLISSILHRISEMLKTPLEYPRDSTLLNSFKKLLEIRMQGSKWENQIDKVNEWATW
jgi:hypothetical protein